MARIKTGLNPWQPVSMARASTGAMFFANGLERPQRWDGITASTEHAGITAPTASCSASASGSGSINGTYRIYVRFLDDSDTPSSFSDSYTTLVATNAATISYTAVPTSTEARVTKREIWRCTTFQYVTWYLDATINDNSTTTASSTSTDAQLELLTALRRLTEEGWPNANRFGLLPDYMSVLVNYRSILWALVPVAYSEGSITSISGAVVTAAGTNFTSAMVGRNLFLSGNLAGTILTVDSTTQVTLSAAPAVGFGTSLEHYAVYPAEDRRNVIMWSELDEPESFPTDDDGNQVNEKLMQEDGDRLVGAMPTATYLYLLKRHSIHRLSTNGDPRNDLAISKVAGRGALNHNCWAFVSNLAFLMDTEGPYLFAGQEPQDIGEAVRDYWRHKIVWRRSRTFFVRHFPGENCVRFFVCLDGSDRPRHALEFNYRQTQWAEIEYPQPVGAGTEVEIDGFRRTILGAADDPVLPDEGVLDGPAPRETVGQTRLASWPQGTVRGTVTSATRYSITDSAADFTFPTTLDHPGVVGAPLAVIAADGTWQRRRIASASGTTITTTCPFSVLPAVGNTYQVGAIEFRVKLGSFLLASSERDNRRDVHLRFNPLAESATLNVRRYADDAATPVNHEVAHDFDDGYSTLAGSPNGQVDLTTAGGYVVARDAGRVPDLSPADRMLDVELEGVAGQERMELYELIVEGAS